MKDHHYITSDGYKVRFGQYGWVFLTGQGTISYSRERTEEIWKEWIVYWKQ